MTTNAKIPVTSTGAGADSKNQVKFTKSVSIIYCDSGPVFREIKAPNIQAFESALKRGLNYSGLDKDQVRNILKMATENNPRPWEKIEAFGLSYSDDENVSVQVHDAVKVNGTLYVNVNI